MLDGRFGAGRVLGATFETKTTYINIYMYIIYLYNTHTLVYTSKEFRY